ncbi:hypothetical protein LTR72_000999 [Exophiala xenobiotica]|nr:hypothetical protein LTR72_000999 [Exophiala xenobiotica]KAK5289621.1 hypothetical protein LTR14_007259 [Exophiala xenobiotica]KAK5440163.1 hypothetical protein LTR18_008100 [Exophiala xenobiotica]KAK5491848.1 hypothetical protein LTR55_003199 [Exophiala xenobiotica]
MPAASTKKRPAASAAPSEKPSKRRSRRSPSPEVGAMSDSELTNDRPYEAVNHAARSFSPQDYVFKLTIKDKTIVNINLEHVLDQVSGFPRTNQQIPSVILGNGPVNEDIASVADEPKSMNAMRGWKDLPYELRLRIYRLTFRGDAAVDFPTRRNLSRSAHVLRTCKQIYREGSEILYSENSFHFDRILIHRGNFWQEKWSEIAYKDARRFFETIGSSNISHLKYLSFNFADGTQGGNPGVVLHDRKYINDTNLMHVFKMVAQNTTLHKLSVCFAGRGFLKNTDRHFWQHFTCIRCRHLEFFNYFRGEENKAKLSVRKQLREIMQAKFDKDLEFDRAEKKKNKVPMVYEDDQGGHDPRVVRIVD